MISKRNVASILLGSSFITLPAQQTTPPNVLFIYADDLGYTDLSCTGSNFYETPNIDRLASEGITFTQSYAACPVSSPSRAALMTGKYPARLHITDYIPGDQAYGPHKDQKLRAQPFNLHLAPEETTIAEAFKQNGYTTFMTGKWHLCEEEQYYPEQNGFDINIGGNKTGHPAGGYFSPYKNPQMKDGPEGEYLTDRLANEVINYLKQPKDKPFFAYLSFYTVHLPMQAKQEKIRKYEEKLKRMNYEAPFFIQHGKTHYKMQQNMAVYAAMVESLDENVGRVLDTLKELGLDENTIVVFTSDNGGMSTCNNKDIIPTSNYPYRAGKGYLYEGGIKVPSFIRWRGHLPKNRKCVAPIIGTDYYPTLLDLCGLPLLPEQHRDGISFKPALYGEQVSRDAIFWHYPHYSGGLGGRPSAAIRSGNYKLIEFFEDKHVELYDVAHDISEQNDLSNARPDLVKLLRDKLHVWSNSVKAQMPSANPDYIPEKK